MAWAIRCARRWASTPSTVRTKTERSGRHRRPVRDGHHATEGFRSALVFLVAERLQQEDAELARRTGSNRAHSWTRTTRQARPEFYLDDPHYANYPVSTVCDKTDDRCGTHINSTIVSHWGYLMAVGGSNADRGATYFDPLDPDLTTSLKNGDQRRISRHYSIARDATFVEFRNATVVAAQQLQKNNIYPNHPKLVSTVRAADALSCPSTPPDRRTYRRPTTRRASNRGSPFAGKRPSLAHPPMQRGIFSWPTSQTSHTSSTPTPRPSRKTSFKLALPFVGATTYYWRVRPHASGAWASTCYPVHSFTTSGNARESRNSRSSGTRGYRTTVWVAQVHPGMVEFSLVERHGCRELRHLGFD